MSTTPNIPIDVVHLLPVLDEKLIELLQSLTADEWQRPTIAKQWTVKDIAAHLLDGNLRGLSFSRDNYFGETPSNINSYNDLVAYINQLNGNWVNATKRLSPDVLIALLEITGKQYAEHLKTLKPFDTAVFAVAWAGQSKSDNWFHIAREYTEKFLHQQQIREAVGKPGILTKEFFQPFADILLFGLPYTYRNTAAETGTTVTVNILTDIGGQWNLVKTSTNWELTKNPIANPNAIVTIEPEYAWRLFTKGMTKQAAMEKIEITGNKQLGEVVLEMVSVMA